VQREAERDGGAGAGGGRHPEIPASFLDQSGEQGESDAALAPSGHGWVEPPSVVGDLELEPGAFLGYGHLYFRRVGVADDVADCFLGDAVDQRLTGLGQAIAYLDVELDVDVACLQGGDQIGEGGVQPFTVKGGGSDR
jgi:hypothetical protein